MPTDHLADAIDTVLQPFKKTWRSMPTEKLYTPADIIKALPVLIKLHGKPFKELKEMYRAGGGPNKGRHVSKRDCILFIAFNESDLDRSPDLTAVLEGTIRELDLQLKAANAGAHSARADANAFEKLYNKERSANSEAYDKNAQLLGAFRQLMKR